jgi:hypothetical protein
MRQIAAFAKSPGLSRAKPVAALTRVKRSASRHAKKHEPVGRAEPAPVHGGDFTAYFGKFDAMKRWRGLPGPYGVSAKAPSANKRRSAQRGG